MLLAEDVLQRLTKIIDFNYDIGNIKTLQELICVKARLSYVYNQEYKDDQSEKVLAYIANLIKRNMSHECADDTVLFYDGFGFDTRGLVQQYLSGLIANHYRILFVTTAKDKSKIPQIAEILEQGNNQIIYSKTEKIDGKIRWMIKLCSKYKFSTAFLYTTPWDIAGIVTFNMLEGDVVRYQINLTDHAFWLGINAFDYCLEFRNYGAAISRDYRKIGERKLIHLPYYPVVNKNVVFQGFPAMCKGRKVIFSGGALYKTIDANNTFYKLVAAVLDRHADVVFLYAGDGTAEGLDSLLKRYPSRAAHVSERSDLINVLNHSRLFLNTYPIGGSLMLQYAAVSGCIPVTLKRKWDDDAGGVLLNEDLLHETFTEENEIIREVDRLIDDDEYYAQKRAQLKGQVITESEFASNLKGIMKNPSDWIFTNINAVNTDMYRKSYDDNMLEIDVVRSIIQRNCYRVWKYFPDFVIKRLAALRGELKITR